MRKMHALGAPCGHCGVVLVAGETATVRSDGAVKCRTQVREYKDRARETRVTPGTGQFVAQGQPAAAVATVAPGRRRMYVIGQPCGHCGTILTYENTVRVKGGYRVCKAKYRKPPTGRPRGRPRKTAATMTAAEKVAAGFLPSYATKHTARIWTPEGGWREVVVHDDGRGVRRIRRVA